MAQLISVPPVAERVFIIGLTETELRRVRSALRLADNADNYDLFVTVGDILETNTGNRG